jgi:predicted TIM-barrel fold metal-dependent hydrolase
MARDGFRIFDTDTHVWDTAETIEQYLDPTYRDAFAAFEREPFRNTDRHLVRTEWRAASRRLGSRGPVERTANHGMGFRGTEPDPIANWESDRRIKDMDIEGIDVHMIVPSKTTAGFCVVNDVDLELAVYRAYHRYMRDYCGAFPDRLTGSVLVSCRNVEASVAELYRAGKERWAVNMLPLAPPELPLDDPSLDPIWAAAADLDLAVTTHTFSWTPPYSPGTFDCWESPFLARCTAHPWSGMRNMATFLGSGMLERHPGLRVGVLETGQGWLPFWLARIEEQAKLQPAALGPGVKPLSEYVAEGRYFQSLELHEGERLTRHVVDFVGPDVLMFSTDYPHGESWFPESVSSFLSWSGFDDATRRKLLWDNAVRFFRRYPGEKQAASPTTHVAAGVGA